MPSTAKKAENPVEEAVQMTVVKNNEEPQQLPFQNLLRHQYLNRNLPWSRKSTKSKTLPW
jgi:hypothetical protein